MDFNISSRSDLSNFSCVFEPWSNEIEQNLNNIQQSQIQLYEETKENIQILAKDKKQLTALHHKQLIESSSFQIELDQLQSTIQELEKENINILPVKINNLNIKQQQIQSEYTILKSTTITVEKNHLNSMNETQRYISKFGNNMGLSFSVIGNKLKINFQYINPMDMMQNYFIIIWAEEDEYKYEKTEPELNAELIEQYMDQLNRNNEMSVFLQKVRKLFIQYTNTQR